jgi:hypothetical protein
VPGVHAGLPCLGFPAPRVPGWGRGDKAATRIHIIIIIVLGSRGQSRHAPPPLTTLLGAAHQHAHNHKRQLQSAVHATISGLRRVNIYLDTNGRCYNVFKGIFKLGHTPGPPGDRSRLVGWLVGWLVRWWVRWLVRWLVSWLNGLDPY